MEDVVWELGRFRRPFRTDLRMAGYPARCAGLISGVLSGRRTHGGREPGAGLTRQERADFLCRPRARTRRPGRAIPTPEFGLNGRTGRSVKMAGIKLSETKGVPDASLLVTHRMAYHFLVARKFTIFGVFTNGQDLPHDGVLNSHPCHLT